MNGEQHLDSSLSCQNTSRIQSLKHTKNQSSDLSDGLTDQSAKNGIVNHTLLYRDAYFQHPGLAYRRHSVASPYEQAASGLEWSVTWRSTQHPRQISYTSRTNQVPVVVRSVEEAVRILLGANPVDWTSSGSDPDRDNHTESQNITSAYIMEENRAKRAAVRKSLDDTLKRLADSRQRLAQLMSLKSESSGQKKQNNTLSGQDKKRNSQNREGSEIGKKRSNVEASSTRTNKNNTAVNAPNRQTGNSLSVLSADARSEAAEPETEKDKVSSAEKELIENDKQHSTDTEDVTNIVSSKLQTEVTPLSTATDTTQESRARIASSSISRINETYSSFMIKQNQTLQGNKKAIKNSLSDEAGDKAGNNIDDQKGDKEIRETARKISYLNKSPWKEQYMTSEHTKADQEPKLQTSKNRNESILYLTESRLTTSPHINMADCFKALRVFDQGTAQIESLDRNKDQMFSSSQRNNVEASQNEHLSEKCIVDETSTDEVTVTSESTMLSSSPSDPERGSRDLTTEVLQKAETGVAVMSEVDFTPAVRHQQEGVSPDVTDVNTDDRVADVTDVYVDNNVIDVGREELAFADNLSTRSGTITVTDDNIDNAEEQLSTVKLNTPDSGVKASDDRFDRYVHHRTDVRHSDMQSTDSNRTNPEAISLDGLLSVSHHMPYEDQVTVVENVCPETVMESSSNLMISKPPEGQEVIQRSNVLDDTPAGQEIGTSQTRMSTDRQGVHAESIGDVTNNATQSELGQTSPENGYSEVGSDLLTGDVRVEQDSVSRVVDYPRLSTCDSQNFNIEVPPRLEPYMFVRSPQHVISPEETLKRIEMLKRRRRCLSAGNLLEADTEADVDTTDVIDAPTERDNSILGEIERIKELQRKKEAEIEARLATKLRQEANYDPREEDRQEQDVNDVSNDYLRSQQIERAAEKLDWYRHKRQTADNMCNARLNRLLAGVGQRFVEHQSEVISKYISPTSRAAAFVLSGARHTSRDSTLSSSSRLSASTDRLHLCGTDDHKPKYKFYTSNPFDV